MSNSSLKTFLLAFALLAGAGMVSWNCSPRAAMTRPEVPFTGERFTSRDRAFSGQIPQGWMVATDKENDSLAPALAALLIKNDYTATITFREIQIDKLTLSLIDKEGLSALARATQSMHGPVPPETEIRDYEMGGVRFSGYEVKGRERVTIFQAKGRYYECTVKPAATGQAAEPLFTAQQAVLGTLSF